YLLAFQNAEHLANKRFLAETLQSVFPSLRIDSRDLVANAKKAADLLEKKYATAPWAQLEGFFSVLGSEKILKWVEQGDRKAVAQYLENTLPVEMLTAREVAFWQGQIEAIRNPSPNNLGYVFRGGRFNVGSAPGYASLSLRTKEHTRKLKSITLAAALSKVSLLNTLYSHSESTSETFISTTTDSSIGTQFSERSGNFSVLAIDSRRILPVYFTRWGESELLIPWLVFPDEVMGSTQKSSVSQLLRSFADKVARTEEVFMEKNNVKTFLQSSLAPMCQSVLL
ncbi:MAG TPA: hypothetical protein VGE46_05025, partial [Bdellovibrio sp.]